MSPATTAALALTMSAARASNLVSPNQQDQPKDTRIRPSSVGYTAANASLHAMGRLLAEPLSSFATRQSSDVGYNLNTLARMNVRRRPHNAISSMRFT